MEMFINITATILLGSLGFYCFFIVFKKYKEDDEEYLGEFQYDSSFLYILSFIFLLILKALKKILPTSMYLLVFKILSFFFGVFLLFVIYLIWTVDFI